MKKEAVDCSVIVKIFIPEPNSDKALRWRQGWRRGESEVWAPQLIVAEFANVIWHKVQRGEISKPVGYECIKDFLELPINIIDHHNLIKGAFNLATAYNITVYDALYAALAYQLNAALITADKELVEKLRHSPVICKSIL